MGINCKSATNNSVLLFLRYNSLQPWVVLWYIILWNIIKLTDAPHHKQHKQNHD